MQIVQEIFYFSKNLLFMLTLSYLRESKEEALRRLLIKNVNAEATINKVLEMDDQRRALQAKMNNLQAELNNISKEVGDLFKQGRKEEADAAKNKSTQIKDSIKQMETDIEVMEKNIQAELVVLPNVAHDSVPRGKSAEDNEVVKTGGTMPTLHANKLPHWELTKKYDIIDFELGTKLTGAGFPVYKGKGAKLQRALISFFLDEAINAGFEEVLPPFMVNEDSGYGTGQLPDKEGQMYHVGVDNFYLVPTAEVPVTNIYRDVIVDADKLPIKNTAYTPCFRREAGSYGKDVRGLNRLHQFDKVEIVVIEKPDRSYQTLETMVAHSVSLLEKLELPYRVLKLCGGDMSFTSALTFDLEVYSAGQDRWLEVSSVSNFESFQANRLKLRYKEKNDKKTQLAHTLNGSALALPRIVAGLLENNQTENGIRIPKALQKYTGFDMIS